MRNAHFMPGEVFTFFRIGVSKADGMLTFKTRFQSHLSWQLLILALFSHPLFAQVPYTTAKYGSPSGTSTAHKIELLQQQLDQLKAESNASVSDSVWYQTPTENSLVSLAASHSGAVIAGPPVLPVEKNYPDVKFSGFFQLDAARFGQSAASVATLGDIQDGTGFRRARLSASGNISEQSSYQMEFDFAQAQARFVDVWGQVKGTPFGTMRIGRFRQPFGMTELTSIRELPFLERPTIFALAPFRQTGIMFSNTAFDQAATWAVSGFRTLADNFGNIYGDDGGWGTAERVSFVPHDGGDGGTLLHVGFDHSYIDPARNQLQFASQDEVFVGQQPNLGPNGLSVLPIVNVPAFVNSGVFNVDHVHLFNVESGVGLGRAAIQSEYRWANVNLPTGQNATVHGGYVTARYVLSGEAIPYNRATGVFGRVKPEQPLNIGNGQWGAWEIATRYSMIDLNPLVGLPGVTGPGRRLNSSDLGINWYWTANSKCQMEWINASLADPTVGKSVTNTLAGRVQFDF
ncbi:MAG: hypothetical protein KDB22_02920 [Planctomycetales bacterium]|nr:hypothetical protein [Planctomycetales bacterium]